MPYACLILIGKPWDGSQRNSCCAQQCLRKQVKEWRQLQTAGSELASRAMRGRAVGSGGALPAAARWRCGYTARLSSISQPLQTCEQRWRAEGLTTNGCRVPSTLRMVGAGPQQAAMAISTRDQAQVLNRKTAGGSQQHSTGTAPAAGVTASPKHHQPTRCWAGSEDRNYVASALMRSAICTPHVRSLSGQPFDGNATKQSQGYADGMLPWLVLVPCWHESHDSWH